MLATLLLAELHAAGLCVCRAIRHTPDGRQRDPFDVHGS
jgi:hypothetical protein